MKSAKCVQCGFVGWSDAEFCKKCGASVSPAPADTLERPADNFTACYSSYDAAPAELKTGLAIASLVMGIANFLLLGIFLLPTIIGIVVSVVALNKIKQKPHEYGGKSLAIGGLVTNIISVVVLVPVMVIAAIAIPNLLAARRAANESAAIRSLRVLHQAEQSYQATTGKGINYGTLSDLQNDSLISADMAREVRSGYRFKVEVFKANSESPAAFAVMAVPAEYGSSGRRSFFIDETGVIRGEDNHGLEASKATPPVNLNSRYPEMASESSRSSRYRDDD
jgi:type II secretory pathway pseudopilin PulG